MDALLEAALQGKAPVKATLVKIELPGGNACLTDGGFVAYDGDTYYGEHATYGSLSSVSAVQDGSEAQTTRVPITVLPKDDTAAALFASPLAQGSRVRWWEGAVDPATGVLIGAPLLKFDGELDYARFSVGSSWSMVLECGTQAERQLEPNVDWRLNDAFHQTVWPAEVGLSHVSNVPKKIYWRMDSPSDGAPTIGFRDGGLIQRNRERRSA